jgi:nucleoid DNA-binding protein
MIKQEVIEKISKYFKLTQFEAEKIYDDIFSIIMHGVKEDNIADVTNLGEFIIKYNNGKSNGNGEDSQGYKKTVEFLASTSMEEDLNQQTQDYRTQQPVTNIKTQDEPQSHEEKPVKQETHDSIEDEFRKKREALLNKISIHPLQDEAAHKHTPPAQPFVYNMPVKPEEPKIVEEYIPEAPVEKQEEPAAEIENKFEEIEPEQPSEKDEDLNQKSFSDYFTEVKNVPSPEEDKGESVYFQEPPNVIPQSAVELHNEITHPVHEEHVVESVQKTASPVIEGTEELVEHKLDDNSYYIWYKDSEANVSETQTMSYEYELLYQATKEAEYKSKLKIYVSTFILFFSMILLLLIFSPVIYKVFFTPVEQENQKTEEQQNKQDNNNGVSEKQNNQNNVQQPVVQNQTQSPADTNKPPVQNQTERQNVQQTQQQQTQQNVQQQQQTPPPVTKQEQPKQEQPKQEQPKQEQPKQEQPKQENAGQTTEPKLDGVVKNTMGYSDEKFKVIYVKLDNGKYTIQESAWDSDSKASKRISIVEGFKINGMKGNVIKVDLGDKGVWFRARFGEFATVEEARVKAEELRNKERIRLQAALIYFFFFT